MLWLIIDSAFFEIIGLGLWFLLFKENPRLKLILYTNLIVGFLMTCSYFFAYFLMAWIAPTGYSFALNPAYQEFWWYLIFIVIFFLLIDIPLYNKIAMEYETELKPLSSKTLVCIGTVIEIFVFMWSITTILP